MHRRPKFPSVSVVLRSYFCIGLFQVIYLQLAYDIKVKLSARLRSGERSLEYLWLDPDQIHLFENHDLSHY
jgi:hypothetical protein